MVPTIVLTNNDSHKKVRFIQLFFETVVVAKNGSFNLFCYNSYWNVMFTFVNNIVNNFRFCEIGMKQNALFL